LSVTQDQTIYLWYRTNVTISKENNSLTYTGRLANAYLLFLNGTFYNSTADYSHNGGATPINLTFSTSLRGDVLVELLSVSLGIDSGGELDYKGIGSATSIKLNGVVVSNWSQQNGTGGELLQIYGAGVNAVPWSEGWNATIGRSATWYNTTFTLANISQFIDNPLLLNVTGLTRGHAYVNGNDIGLYWTLPGLGDYSLPSWACQDAIYDTAGEPTQILYHIPPDWLYEGTNNLTIFEDTGIASLATVNLVQKVVTEV